MLAPTSPVYPISAREWLAWLVAFDTTSRNSNLALVESVEAWLDGLGVRATRVTGAEGRKANLLFSVGGELAARQQQLHLVVAPGSPIERMLQIVGADRAFPVHPDREAALAT